MLASDKVRQRINPVKKYPDEVVRLQAEGSLRQFKFQGEYKVLSYDLPTGITEVWLHRTDPERALVKHIK